MPQLNVYDFTKRSKNFTLMQDDIHDQYESEMRTNSKIEYVDLPKLEAELKKKQEKRLKKALKEENKRLLQAARVPSN